MVLSRELDFVEIKYRAAVDEDADGLIELVDRCYADYEGCILDVDAEEPQLRYIATYFAEKDGEFWVATRDAQIVGSIGYTYDKRVCEIKHLYVDNRIRRQGIATRLCDLVENAAHQREAEKLILWTDTRFETAHQLYERRGFKGKTETRELQDLSQTTEYYYEKSLRSA
ncbi:GNAT family N-acetyltransferase [Sneathiella limimaris]|uniref:GNAT family N-acetyltransferase n=1 Tax=Sneathiella limimaris TaxID=1964213 RepID=UPI001F0F3DD6|nr:GNAT family N-acetyltransferase [Sneathiella limimaris]